MVLEISINGSQFVDIIAAGGSFAVGGYNATMSNATGSPIGGRMAWSGLSGGTTADPAYITTTVNMPPSAVNQPVKLKWLVASDSSTVAAGDQGARLDTMVGIACQQTTAAGVAVSGRVLTPSGRGLVNASVLISDQNGVLQTARTSSFGYYRFDGVVAGQTYIVRVDSQRYTFDPQVIVLLDNIADLDFIGRE